MNVVEDQGYKVECMLNQKIEEVILALNLVKFSAGSRSSTASLSKGQTPVTLNPAITFLSVIAESHASANN